MTATRVMPAPPDGVHVATDGIERVEPLDVVRQRIRYGDPPTLDPPDTLPADEELPCDRD